MRELTNKELDEIERKSNKSLNELGELFSKIRRIAKEKNLLEHMEAENEVSLRALLDLYQQERKWEKAVKIAQQLGQITGENHYHVIAHYYCELAIAAKSRGDLTLAQETINKALASDHNSVRAGLLQGELAMEMGQLKQAIKAYTRIIYQAPDYLSQVLEPLVSCYEQSQLGAELVDFLQDILTRYPRISVVLALAKKIHEREGQAQAEAFLKEQLIRRPSLRGLKHLLEMQLSKAQESLKESLRLYQGFIDKLLENKHIYQCQQCGFSGGVLHWQCPSCKQWNTVKPIHGVEGD